MALNELPPKMDAYDTVAQLKSILRIFSLHNVYRKHVIIPTKFPYSKSAFILFCFGFMTFCNVYYLFCSKTLADTNLSVKFTETSTSTFCYSLFLIDIYYVHKYGGETCVAYYKTYDSIDLFVEMKYHRAIKRKVSFSNLIFLSLWAISSVIDYVAWWLCYGWVGPTMYTVHYFTSLFRMLTVLELNAHTMHIGYRLETIADVLKGHFALVEDLPFRLSVVQNLTPVDIQSKVVVPPKIRDADEILRLSSYYLVLRQQATFINDLFGARILLHCVFTLTQVIAYINLIARIFVGTMFTSYDAGYFPAVTSMMRLSVCAAVLISMVYRCEQSSSQSGHVISALDDVLVNKKTSPEIRSSLKQLRLLVTTQPIRFHAATFFNLDSSLLLSTASVVATYAVLLLQSTP